MFKLADAGMNTYCRLTIDALSPRYHREYPHTYLIFLGTRIIGRHFAADNMGLPSLKSFSWVL